MILDFTNNLEWVQIALDKFKIDFFELIFVFCTRPKQIGTFQNDVYLSKIIWTV